MATGGSPRGIASGDFDNDGHVDVAFANNYMRTITVHYGNGQGGSARTATFDSGRGPYGMASADLNGDSLLDLVVANGSNNNVSVLLGTASGNFATQRFFATGTDPRSVAAADFTGDGRLDLVVANSQGHSFSFLRNTGSGNFATSVNTPAGTNPAAIAAGDFNGDGLQDVAVTNAASGNVMVFRGNGSGAFVLTATLTTGPNPLALAVEDLDGDGDADLLVPSLTANTVTLFRGDGTGQFATGFVGTVESGPFGVGAADFDGDGVLDIAVASATANKLSIFKGTGPGYLPAKVFSAGLYARVLTIADFDEDQKPDIAFANTAGDNGWILRNAQGVGDLSVSINDSVTIAPPGTQLTYLIVVTNHGPFDVAGASLTTLLPPSLINVTWTCTASPGSSCSAGGSGTIADTVSVKDHGAVTYAMAGTVAPDAGGTLTVTASVSVPPPGADSFASNDVAADSDGVGINHEPVATSQSVNAAEDTTGVVRLVGKRSGQRPAHLVHCVAAGSRRAVRQWLQRDLHARVELQRPRHVLVRVNDGFVNSNVATVTIAVAPVNDGPVANPQSVSLPQDSSLGLVLTGADVETRRSDLCGGQLAGTRPVVRHWRQRHVYAARGLQRQ